MATRCPARGPLVNRRNSANITLPSNGRVSPLKPSVKETIESCVSTGSQGEWFKPEQTILIFDWDDTLCPSTWLKENRLIFSRPSPSQERYQKPLRELQEKVSVLLSAASKLGKVIIVTNAQSPWIEHSCKNFMPDIWPLISSIPMIYARSIYETQHCEPIQRGPAVRFGASTAPGSRLVAAPGMYTPKGPKKLFPARLAKQPMQIDPQAWKEVAFEQEISGFYSQYKHQSWKNIVSIGDAVFERDAVRKVVFLRPSVKKQCRTKTVKLLDDPTVEELICQVALVTNMLSVAVQHDGNLDVEIDEEDLTNDGSLTDKVMKLP